MRTRILALAFVAVMGAGCAPFERVPEGVKRAVETAPVSPMADPVGWALYVLAGTISYALGSAGKEVLRARVGVKRGPEKG
jgi:hypothetical protein